MADIYYRKCIGKNVWTYFLIKFRKLKSELDAAFPGQLDITGEGTPNSTGWFEVDINGKLVHSKKNGDGYVDSSAKKDKIINAIKEALAK